MQCRPRVVLDSVDVCSILDKHLSRKAITEIAHALLESPAQFLSVRSVLRYAKQSIHNRWFG